MEYMIFLGRPILRQHSHLGSVSVHRGSGWTGTEAGNSLSESSELKSEHILSRPHSKFGDLTEGVSAGIGTGERTLGEGSSGSEILGFSQESFSSMRLDLRGKTEFRLCCLGTFTTESRGWGVLNWIGLRLGNSVTSLTRAFFLSPLRSFQTGGNIDIYHRSSRRITRLFMGY